jgi:uncharacterized membrane protein YfcA
MFWPGAANSVEASQNVRGGSAVSAAVLGALFGIAFLAYAIQTATGFGSVLVSITLGAHLLSIPELLLLILPLSLMQCGYIAARYRGHIDWGLLLRWIVPVMGLGTTVGAFLSRDLSGDLLKRILAGLVLLLAVVELASLAGWLRASARPLGPLGRAVGLVGAGLMHGIYAAGGPLLVYTLGRTDIDKSAFRSTITLVWLVLNIGLVGYYLIDGRFAQHHVVDVGILVPGVVVGIIIGDKLHHRLDGKGFRVALYVMLALVALSLLLR